MNEAYRGTASDRQYIRAYLRSVRRLLPEEMFTLARTVSLTELALTTNEDFLDFSLFQRLVRGAFQRIRTKFSPLLHLLKSPRYFLGIPEGRKTIGGFFSKHSVGYHNFFHAAYTVPILDLRQFSNGGW